jgi:hypothetical protein
MTRLARRRNASKPRVTAAILPPHGVELHFLGNRRRGVR